VQEILNFISPLVKEVYNLPLHKELNSKNITLKQKKFINNNKTQNAFKDNADISEIQKFFYNDFIKGGFSLLTSKTTSDINQERSYIPHFDALDDFKIACLHYLTLDENCYGGTSFYKVPGIGKHKVNNKDLETYSTFFKNFFLKTYDVDRNPGVLFIEDLKESVYERINLIPLKFNRLVIYHAQLLHGATIIPAKLTEDVKKGRLSANFFIEGTNEN
jgi:hypothetical protein